MGRRPSFPNQGESGGQEGTRNAIGIFDPDAEARIDGMLFPRMMPSSPSLELPSGKIGKLPPWHSLRQFVSCRILRIPTSVICGKSCLTISGNGGRSRSMPAGSKP